MYKIILGKFGEETKELLANTHEELRAVITLAPEEDYEIISVEKYLYDLAEDFLQEIIKESKPINLVYGSDDSIEGTKIKDIETL